MNSKTNILDKLNGLLTRDLHDLKIAERDCDDDEIIAEMRELVTLRHALIAWLQTQSQSFWNRIPAGDNMFYRGCLTIRRAKKQLNIK